MKVLGPKDTNVYRSKTPSQLKIGKKRPATARKHLVRELKHEGIKPHVVTNSSSGMAPENIREPLPVSLLEAANDVENKELERLPTPELLTQYALDQIQFVLCEREMETAPCGHPFCQKLRTVKLSLPELRNLLLFELEMIPEQFRAEMTSLRGGCYCKQVYNQLWPDWKTPSKSNPEDNKPTNCEGFPIGQLFIGEPISQSQFQAIFPIKTSDRVRSRRKAMPRSLLAQRNQTSVFDEPFNPTDLLKDSSSISLSTYGHRFDQYPDDSRRRNRLNCILGREIRKPHEMKPSSSKENA
ncbi:LAME_0F11254g1_1 [Lachancea meyersii CBS 8951]|uniref:LAME_0F11254g1_1 n=1 Tax=Lachancea meyersii CBS 8951 TaxID=1266667 RepID=A0A1G4JW13_9SACH|nr:LAME_0F11254g1_1 [Lachancea meyersii CBS 8951]